MFIEHVQHSLHNTGGRGGGLGGGVCIRGNPLEISKNNYKILENHPQYPVLGKLREEIITNILKYMKIIELFYNIFNIYGNFLQFLLSNK